MKFLIFLVASFVVFASAADNVNVLRSDAEVNPDSFKYAYEFDNSIKAEQQGSLQGVANWIVSGQYGYTSPEGEQVSLQYVADENGYHVSAANPALPTPPPIPEAIQKALAYIAAHPSKE